MFPYQFVRYGRHMLYFCHPLAKSLGKVSYGKYAEIGAYSFINAGPEGVYIGSYSQINPLVSIIGNVTIGERVMIAPSSVITSGGHRFGKNIRPRFAGSEKVDGKKLCIEDDVWIGANVTIIGNITIGHGSVIAAGVTVDRNIPPETLVRRSNTFLMEKIH